MNPVMPQNALSYHLRRAEQETLMAISSLVPRAEASHAALARLHAEIALELLTGIVTAACWIRPSPNARRRMQIEQEV